MKLPVNFQTYPFIWILKKIPPHLSNVQNGKNDSFYVLSLVFEMQKEHPFTSKLS